VNLDLEFTILLPGGGVFRFSGPFPIAYEQWEHIRRVMDAMAPGLVATAHEASDGCTLHRRSMPVQDRLMAQKISAE
jgi:ActR/RegA family two-component response regulator